jgi:hypothetical protein
MAGSLKAESGWRAIDGVEGWPGSYGVLVFGNSTGSDSGRNTSAASADKGPGRAGTDPGMVRDYGKEKCKYFTGLGIDDRFAWCN